MPFQKVEKEVYAYTFQVGNRKYSFTSFHKSRIMAKLEFILDYLLGEAWELGEVSDEVLYRFGNKSELVELR